MLTKNVDPDKHSHSEYGVWFDFRSFFSFPNFDLGKNDIIL